MGRNWWSPDDEPTNYTVNYPESGCTEGTLRVLVPYNMAAATVVDSSWSSTATPRTMFNGVEAGRFEFADAAGATPFVAIIRGTVRFHPVRFPMMLFCNQTLQSTNEKTYENIALYEVLTACEMLAVLGAIFWVLTVIMLCTVFVRWRCLRTVDTASHSSLELKELLETIGDTDLGSDASDDGSDADMGPDADMNDV